LGPGDLNQVLRELPILSDSNLLSGLGEDAGIYRLREDLAIVVTLDYFNPIVKEAYMYGQIATANALSDVYAMGGEPIIAMNIVCFPVTSMDLSILKEVLRGAADKLKEANVILIGGHSVIDPQEIKYGLSVVGVVNPEKIMTKGNFKVGDKLVLTKALGTGIINNALKGKMMDEKTEAEVAASMATLNKGASEVAREMGIHACTDITGFGLGGHLYEMVRESKDKGIKVDSALLPLFPRVEEFAKKGLIPPGTQRNRKFQGDKVQFSEHVPEWKRLVVFDAQTSGGLVLSVPPEKAETFLKKLREEGVEKATVIGEVVEKPRGMVVVE
jgi:selenide,water dikinase